MEHRFKVGQKVRLAFGNEHDWYFGDWGDMDRLFIAKAKYIISEVEPRRIRITEDFGHRRTWSVTPEEILLSVRGRPKGSKNRPKAWLISAK